MKENTQLMTVGDYKKKIILFTIPLFIGNLFGSSNINVGKNQV